MSSLKKALENYPKFMGLATDNYKKWKDYVRNEFGIHRKTGKGRRGEVDQNVNQVGILFKALGPTPRAKLEIEYKRVNIVPAVAGVAHRAQQIRAGRITRPERMAVEAVGEIPCDGEILDFNFLPEQWNARIIFNFLETKYGKTSIEGRPILTYINIRQGKEEQFDSFIARMLAASSDVTFTKEAIDRAIVMNNSIGPIARILRKQKVDIDFKDLVEKGMEIELEQSTNQGLVNKERRIQQEYQENAIANFDDNKYWQYQDQKKSWKRNPENRREHYSREANPKRRKWGEYKESRGTSNGRNGTRPQRCYNCGGLNHITKTCFYTPWGKFHDRELPNAENGASREQKIKKGYFQNFIKKHGFMRLIRGMGTNAKSLDKSQTSGSREKSSINALTIRVRTHGRRKTSKGARKGILKRSQRRALNEAELMTVALDDCAGLVDEEDCYSPTHRHNERKEDDDWESPITSKGDNSPFWDEVADLLEGDEQFDQFHNDELVEDCNVNNKNDDSMYTMCKKSTKSGIYYELYKANTRTEYVRYTKIANKDRIGVSEGANEPTSNKDRKERIISVKTKHKGKDKEGIKDKNLDYLFGMDDIVETNKRGKNLVHILVRLNLPGQTRSILAQALVDTGGARSVIDAEFLRRKAPAVKVRPSQAHLTAAGGHRLRVVGQVTLDITLAGRRIRHNFTVVENFSFNVLLGIDLLRDNVGATIDLGKGTIQLPGCKGYPLMALTEDATPRIRYEIVAACDMLLLPRTRYEKVPVKVINPEGITFKNSLYVEGGVANERALQAGLYVPTMLINPNPDRTYIQLMNANFGKRVRIVKGQHLGIGTRIAEVLLGISDDAPAVGEGVKEKWNKLSNGKRTFNVSELSVKQKEDMTKLLTEFDDLFDGILGGPKATHLNEHTIELTSDKPTTPYIYQLPHNHAAWAEEQVKEMLKNDMVRMSQSDYRAPVVISNKKGGKLRFCVDYRALNKVTKADTFPMPKIEDILTALEGAKFFSTLDAASGYWQIPVKEEHKKYTAFATRSGLYEWNRMPFGLRNSGATFQRTLNILFTGLNWNICMIYVDDILIYSKTWEEHMVNLRKVFVTLRKGGISLKPSKCFFGCKRVEFLGHIITKDGLEMDPNKTSALRKLKYPENRKGIQIFLGLCNYYRKFVKDFAAITLPITHLLKKDIDFIWGSLEKKAFHKIIDELCKNVILHYPNFNIKFIVTTDASKIAFGATLSQNHQGEDRTIRFWSKTTNKHEKNYSATDLELRAIVYALQKFRHYLLGRKFTIRTDHSALKWLMSKGENNSTRIRWLLKIQEFVFDVEHRPGKTLVVEDALSRLTGDSENIAMFENFDICDWIEGQEKDGFFKHVKDYLLGGTTLAHIDKAKAAIVKKAATKIEMRQGLLIIPNKDGTVRLCVPKENVSEILRMNHDHPTAGHFGIAKTLARIKAQYYWPKYRQDALNWVKSCVQCGKRKNPPGKRIGLLKPICAEYPGHIVAVDIKGPMPKTPSGYVYILVITDLFTKWPTAVPLKTIDALVVARHLCEDYVAMHGIPTYLMSDQGGQFTGNILKAACEYLKIKKLFTTTYRPQADGGAERMIGTLVQCLSKYLNKYQNDWDQYLQLVLFAYRTTPHLSTGISPFEMLFGRAPRLNETLRVRHALENATPGLPQEYIKHLGSKLHRIHMRATDNLEKARRGMKKQYDKNRRKFKFLPGEGVWLFRPKLGRRKRQDEPYPANPKPRLARRWKKGFEIEKEVLPDVYKLRNTKTGKLVIRVYNADHIKLQTIRNKDLQSPRTELPDEDTEENGELEETPAQKIAARDLGRSRNRFRKEGGKVVRYQYPSMTRAQAVKYSYFESAIDRSQPETRSSVKRKREMQEEEPDKILHPTKKVRFAL